MRFRRVFYGEHGLKRELDNETMLRIVSLLMGIVFLVMGLALVVSGCRNRTSKQAWTNQGGKPAESAATPQAGEAAPGSGGSSLQAPLGVYSISEVDRQAESENLVAHMIPAHREIQISFKPDGSFMRVSWRQNMIALSETGTYRVESPDQLVLLATEVNKKPITDGRKTSYRFALSPD